MKTVLEFGVRGGYHTENTIIPTQILGAELASKMVKLLSGNECEASSFGGDWYVTKKKPRVTWQSSTHFVALSLLDGFSRGPAASKLWKKEN